MIRSKPSRRIILGIDPGSRFTGYGVIESKGNQLGFIEAGTLTLHTYATHAERLGHLLAHMGHWIKAHKPIAVAIEDSFYGRNAQSMLKLGRIQGVVLASAALHQVSVAAYAPKRIKQSVTGNGNALKAQVAFMLSKLLHTPLDALGGRDATDALATAVCHHFAVPIRAKPS